MAGLETQDWDNYNFIPNKWVIIINNHIGSAGPCLELLYKIGA